MTTFDDDFMRIHMDNEQTTNHMVKHLNFQWPPPERIAIDLFSLGDEILAQFREAKDDDLPNVCFVRERMSAITDDQRASMTQVCRGSEYFPATWPRKKIERHL